MKHGNRKQFQNSSKKKLPMLKKVWRVCGDSIPRKNTKRQGTTKTIVEVNDISSALDTLAEKDCLPMFLSNSDMVKRTPVCEPKTV